jgi:hypothetical protein
MRREGDVLLSLWTLAWAGEVSTWTEQDLAAAFAQVGWTAEGCAATGSAAYACEGHQDGQYAIVRVQHFPTERLAKSAKTEDERVVDASVGWIELTSAEASVALRDQLVASGKKTKRLSAQDVRARAGDWAVEECEERAEVVSCTLRSPGKVATVEARHKVKGMAKEGPRLTVQGSAYYIRHKKVNVEVLVTDEAGGDALWAELLATGGRATPTPPVGYTSPDVWVTGVRLVVPKDTGAPLLVDYEAQHTLAFLDEIEGNLAHVWVEGVTLREHLTQRVTQGQHEVPDGAHLLFTLEGADPVAVPVDGFDTLIATMRELGTVH